MMNIKRVISAFLTVSLCVGYAHAEKIETGKKLIGFETELMEVLGIMENDNLSKELTRVDFIQMLSKMIFYGEDYTDIATEEKPFEDVENYHYASSNIERLAQRGIISGDGNGYAKINDIITFDEVCVMMLNAAGYYDVAKSYGDYPQNYRRLASETGLTKNVTVTDKVTKETAAKLLANLMEIETVKVKLQKILSLSEVVYSWKIR